MLARWGVILIEQPESMFALLVLRRFTAASTRATALLALAGFLLERKLFVERADCLTSEFE